MRAAGGGRGKTRVLTTRIAWLLATGQALPLSILAVTFTNKAAKEMLLRLSTLTPINTRGMWIGTFHGLCNRMLRAHYRDANLPQLFQIMDTQDQLALIKRLYKAHNIDDERFPARQLQYFIASAKEEGLRPSAVEAGDELARRQVEHYAMYEAMCQREGAVDFAELLLRSYELLRAHAGLREQYYRSHGHILDAANALIRFNQARLGKNLWTADSKGEPIRAFAALSDLDEAAFIVDVVKGLAADGVALSECAVLYRSNAQSRVLEHALFNAAIPYRVYGGMRFFERAEVKHALAYLRLLASPVDDGAFLRVVNFPPRGIGARTLETLQDTARARGTSLWEAASAGVVTGKSGNALAAFVKLIEAMQAGTAGLPLPEAVEHVNEASGLIAHYRTEKDGEDRLENLEVFVNGLEEGLFPHENSLSEADGVEEERRLMYVAITRAKRRLYLTLAQSRMLHGQVRYHIASRFVDEIPRELVQWLSALTHRRSIEVDTAQWGARWARSESAAPLHESSASASATGWRIGQSVRHAKFGVGVIVDAEGRGSDARVQVNFREAGLKWLALE